MPLITMRVRRPFNLWEECLQFSQLIVAGLAKNGALYPQLNLAYASLLAYMGKLPGYILYITVLKYFMPLQLSLLP